MHQITCSQTQAHHANSQIPEFPARLPLPASEFQLNAETACANP